MLQSMRGFAGGLILKLFLGLIILSFAVWGIGDFLHPGAGGDAASVGSVKISAARLSEEVRRQTAQIRQMFGGQVPEEMLKAMNVDSMVLKQMVQEELLRQGAERHKLYVDDAVVTKLLAANPAFRDEQGKFDRERFRQVLWNMGKGEAQYVEDLKQNVSVMFLVQAVTANAFVPKSKIEVLHAIEGQKRVAEYVQVLPSAVNVPAKPEEAVLETFYKDRKAEFALPEVRKVSYISFSKEDVGKDATSEALYALANKVEDSLAGGASLEEVAKNLGLKLKKIEKLEAYTDAKTLPDGANFVHQAFGIDQGNESGLTLSQDQGTYYVIRVDAVTPVTEQPLQAVRERVVAAWKVAEKERLMKAKAEAIAERLHKGEALGTIAAAEKMTVQRSNPLTRESFAPLPAEFAQQLFQTSKGFVKGAYPIGGGGYVVGQLAEVIKAAPLSDKEIAALQQKMQESVFDDLLSQYTLYLQKKTPVTIKAQRGEAE